MGGEAFARLGQTEEQVTALFGKSVDSGTPDKEGVTTNMYKNPSGEYHALVQFLKGHGIAEAYSRVDGAELAEKEIPIFLQGNCGGKEWIKIPTSSRGKEATIARRRGPKRFQDDRPCLCR